MTAVEIRRETIRIDAESRWDALDLAARLHALHTYLVQLGDSRWLVCVRPEGDEDVLATVRETVEAWAAERSLESAIHVGDSTYVVRR